MNEITKRELNGFQRGIRERTVPENMRWPMFEDGKAVALGDATEDCRCVTRICFTKKGFYFNSSHRKGLRRYRYGEAVRRPWTPDADGVRTKVGDTVWNIGSGVSGVVSEVNGDHVKVAYTVGYTYGPARAFVHEKPVFGKDGSRLRVGATVFRDFDENEMTVMRIDRETEAVLCASGDRKILLPAKLLVSDMPDSWDRLFENTENGYVSNVEMFKSRAMSLAGKAAV